MAAVLACGPEACLSHGDAAALHGLQRPGGRLIHVTAPTGHAPPGIRRHVTRAPARTSVDGIPVTPIERTVLDQAPRLSQQRLRSTLEALQRRGDFDYNRFTALLQTANGRRGIGELKRALEALTDEPPWLQSDLERDFLELVRAAGLPEPSANVVVDGALVDFFWPAQNLVVEIDSILHHHGKRPFEDDRRRDAKHTVAGRRSLRPTHERITHDARGLVSDLSALLGVAPSGP
jgi:very-short-patch-repair endonuclease